MTVAVFPVTPNVATVLTIIIVILTGAIPDLNSAKVSVHSPASELFSGGKTPNCLDKIFPCRIFYVISLKCMSLELKSPYVFLTSS